MSDIDIIRGQEWKRVVVPGVFTPSWYKVRRAVPVFVEIEWQYHRNKHWELSITGVEGPNIHGNCVGSCGQCRDFEIHGLAKGWTFDMLARLRQVWERWHLNGMRAGSPDQEAWLRDHPYDRQRDGDHYKWAQRVLGEAGLNPDPTFFHPTKTRDRVVVTAGWPSEIVRTPVADVPYQYGHAWIYEPVPDEVLDFLFHLPKADRPHPWGDTDRIPEGLTL